MCDGEITNKQIKVKDHDHFNGEYRGLAHQSCNINCKKPKRIPIIFHNGSKYYVHLFIKSLSEHGKYNSFNIISKTTEEYLSVRYGCLMFLDSLRFFGMSLEKVGDYLQDSDFKLFRKCFIEQNFTNCDDDKNLYKTDLWKLFRKKGVFPYNYITSFENNYHQ